MSKNEHVCLLHSQCLVAVGAALAANVRLQAGSYLSVVAFNRMTQQTLL